MASMAVHLAHLILYRPVAGQAGSIGLRFGVDCFKTSRQLGIDQRSLQSRRVHLNLTSTILFIAEDNSILLQDCWAQHSIG
jgi:hypothetical protein